MTENSCESVGQKLHNRIRTLFPICRSITGNGVRQTLAELQISIPLEIREVASGTSVFDWTVPAEWNIKEAWIKNPSGQKVIDFAQHNLHVVSYSTPIHAKMPLAELRQHLHSLPDQPQVIPYKTSYYKQDWGFCLAHEKLQSLIEGEYEVLIDSSLEPGSLTYGELLLPGEVSHEILISAHICHPSLANDNLSGVVVAAEIAAEMLSRTNRYYSYRFVFIPGTIGAITWLAKNENTAANIKHGLVLSGLGDPGGITYKRSRRDVATIDSVAEHVLEEGGFPHAIQDFSPYGYDERQYCSPGFNLPVGRFSRSPYGTYPQYHTSDDNLDFVTSEALDNSLRTVMEILSTLEENRTYVNINPKCEPQLGRRGLYQELSDEGETMAMLWLLNLSDGEQALLEIAKRAAIPFKRCVEVAKRLEAHGLLRKLS